MGPVLSNLRSDLQSILLQTIAITIGLKKIHKRIPFGSLLITYVNLINVGPGIYLTWQMFLFSLSTCKLQIL